MTQAQALAILKTGANVFLTGEPGAGKTHTVNMYTTYLRERGINPSITASTGIAATHIGGMTIHSWSGIGIARFLDRYALDRIASNERTVKRVSSAKVLIIDEVSMLGPETLLMIDAVCREIRRTPEPFGGLQVILVGDFFQLPPVQSVQPDARSLPTIAFAKEREARFAFESEAWKKLNPVVCYLTEQHRQSDAAFLSLLASVRSNSFGEAEERIIATRMVVDTEAPSLAPKLYSHNVDVDRVNDQQLAALPGPSTVFTMVTRGHKPLVETLQKGCLSPEVLMLKVGAAVMFTKNSPNSGFANGTLGAVKGYDEAGNPVVRTRDGESIVVLPVEWNLEDHGRVLAQIIQLPLRLAWAITVHKSQGMSLDEAVMDLSRVFEYGQGYVALSRVRELGGVYLLGSNPRAFEVHPAVVAEDQGMRDASDAAALAFGELSSAELEGMFTNFILACGGTAVAEKQTAVKRGRSQTAAPGSKFEKIREKYPNAYRAWTADEDAKLMDLFSEGASSATLGETFGRKAGAVRTRLLKLGLIEAYGEE